MPQLKVRGQDPSGVRETLYRETPIWKVLQIQNQGPSPVGSSYNKAFFSCPREHALRHVALVESSRVSDPLSLGLAWHLLLEHYYKKLMVGATQSEALKKPFELVEVLEQHPEYKDMGDKLRAMLDAYLERWESEDKWQILAVEETLIYRGEVEYSARLDLVVVDLARGGLFLIEHKCLPAAAKVTLASGARVELRELLGKTAQVLSFDPSTGRVCSQKMDRPRPAGVRPVYEITLKSGRVLRCSGNHPVQTAHGWMRAEEITRADFVAIPRQTSLNRKPTLQHDIDLAFVTGALLGDGTMSSFRWTRSDGPVQDRFRECLQRLGAAFTKSYNGPKRKVDIRISRKTEVCRQFHAWGLLTCRASEKFIPAECFSWSRAAMKALVEGLWQTDGCIALTGGLPRLTYSTRSKQLADGLQQLMLNLGVYTTVGRSTVLYKGQRRPYWMVRVVYAQNKLNFLQTFDCGRPAQATAVELLRTRADDEPIPRALLRGIRQTRVHTSTGAVTARFVADEIRASERACGRDSLKELDWAVWWDRVKSVRRQGRELMYDVTVANSHVVVADDVVTHNSARFLSLELLDNYQLDLQILGQVWLAERVLDLSAYPQLRGVIVNITTTGHVRPKCARTEVYPSRAHLDAFYRAVRDWPYMRALSEKLGYPQALGHCGGYARGYSRCEYFDLCHGRPEMSVADWQRAQSDDQLPLGYQRVSYARNVEDYE